MQQQTAWAVGTPNINIISGGGGGGGADDSRMNATRLTRN